MDDDHGDSRRHGLDDSGRDSQDDSRWLTYDEIATIKRIKRSGAIRWVQRHRWRRQTGNDGQVRALVPGNWLRRHQSHDSLDDSRDDSRRDTGHDSRHNTEHDSVALSDASLRADEANRRADVALALVTDANARADRAEEGRRAAEMQAADLVLALQAKDSELVELRTAADQARAEAEKARQAAETRITSLEADADRARGVAEEAVQAAETLQVAIDELRVGQGAQALELEQAQRAAQAAQEAAEALRQADAERKARGRWARLRAAWRGE